jgi:hypothetical protein
VRDGMRDGEGLDELCDGVRDCDAHNSGTVV